MNPFIRKVKTVEEKNELLKQARAEYDAAGAANFLIAPTWEAYIEQIAETIEVETSFVPPTPLTPAENADLDRRLSHDAVFSRVFGNRAEREEIPAWFAKTHEDNQRREREELLGPARRANDALDDLVEKAINRVLAKSGSSDRATLPVRPIPEREPLMRMLNNPVDEGNSSDAGTFLAAFIGGDEKAMRAIARKIAAEELAA